MKWLASCLLVFTLQGQASTAQELVKILKNYRNFSAEFKQTLTDQEGTPTSAVFGEFAVDGPDTFYWRTNAPFSQLIVADGEVLWVYDEDLSQVQVRPLDDTLKASPAYVLGASAIELSQNFKVESQKAEMSTLYTLTPYSEDDAMQQMI